METPGPKTTGYSFWHTLMKVLLLLVALVLIEEGLFTLLANRQARLLEQELDGWRAQGYLRMPEQLQQPMPPESQNAAPLYLKAARQARTMDPSGEALKELLIFQTTPEAIASAKTVQPQLEALLSLVREAASRPECRFPVEVEHWGVSSDTYGALSALRSRLEALCALQLLEGRYGAGIETFGLLWAADSLFRAEPSDTRVVAAFRYHASRVYFLQHLLKEVRLPASQCLRLADLLRGFDAFPLMERGCAFSVAEYGGFLHWLAAGEAPPSWLAEGEAPPSAFLLDHFAPDWLSYVVDHCALGRWLALECGSRVAPLLVQLEALSRKRMPTWQRLEQARVLETEARSGRLAWAMALREYAARVRFFQGDYYAKYEADLACSEVALSAGAVATTD